MIHRRRFLGTAAAIAAAAALPGPRALAQGVSPEAERFIEDLGRRAVETIARAELPDPERDARFRALLQEGFDIPAIGQFVLGRYWNAATPEQRREYLDLFERMIVDVYAERFEGYSGESLKVIGSQPAGRNDLVVQSEIVRPAGGPPVRVDWRVRQTEGGWKIIDVIVEGVSMGVTQRSDFASVIQSRGGKVEGLIQALRERTGATG